MPINDEFIIKYYKWCDIFILVEALPLSTQQDIINYTPLEDRNYVSHSKKKTQSHRIKYVNSNHPVRERPIPKTHKKKYPTKPKNPSKIKKMNAKSDKFGLLQ